MKLTVSANVITGYMLDNFFTALERKAKAIGATLVTKRQDIVLTTRAPTLTVREERDKYIASVTHYGAIYLEFRLAQQGKHYRIALDPFGMEYRFKDLLHGKTFDIVHKAVDDMAGEYIGKMADALIHEA